MILLRAKSGNFYLYIWKWEVLSLNLKSDFFFLCQNAQPLLKNLPTTDQCGVLFIVKTVVYFNP